MSRISMDGPAGQFLVDQYLWKNAEGEDEDNSEQIQRLKRNLRRAKDEVLTPRQREILELYYEEGLTMGQIALKLHINTSVVSRTLQRARQRLYNALRYSL